MCPVLQLASYDGRKNVPLFSIDDAMHRISSLLRYEFNSLDLFRTLEFRAESRVRQRVEGSSP